MFTAEPDGSRPACADEDPELFFPGEKSAADLLQKEAAKAVCGHCPLIERCLQGALDRNEQGVWGGTDEDDRRRMKRRAARKRASA
ncbi:WhiB family transcriptional regulator [Streptomyces sp. ISL-12]|nr:WhiB family transcriptional regulator [Streptomyces sp. ISL-12]MBT2414418.1 WhiB family transcriptional regulator [Streptomyces sp. ISL-12]